MAQHVHGQFARVGEGQAQQPAAVGVPAAHLLRVPGFGGHPAGAFGGEAQRGPLHLAAGEDAVAGAQHRVQFGLGHVDGGALDDAHPLDGVHAEAAQRLAPVAVGVQVPVVAVVHQALGRNLTLAALAGAPALVVDDQALAAQQGRAHGLEVRQVQLARPHGQHPHTTGHVGRHRGAAAQGLGQALAQRFDVRAQQAAGVQVGQQVLHGQQRVDFFGTEPQAGQFVLRTHQLLAGVQQIATALAAEGHRHVHLVAQQGDVALERGRRDLQLGPQPLGREAAARVQPALELVEPVVDGHGSPCLRPLRGGMVRGPA